NLLRQHAVGRAQRRLRGATIAGGLAEGAVQWHRCGSEARHQRQRAEHHDDGAAHGLAVGGLAHTGWPAFSLARVTRNTSATNPISESAITQLRRLRARSWSGVSAVNSSMVAN